MEKEIIEREIELNQENFEITSEVDIDVNKVDKTTTVSIVRWDGSTKEVEIYDGQDGKNGVDGKDGKDGINGRDGINGKDGKDGVDGKDGSNGVGLNYNWSGTSLGIKREDEQNYNYVNLKGDTGATGATGATGPAGKDGKDGKDGTNGQNGQDGVGISSITKTSTSGLVDTYTITYTNGNTETYQITNGADGSPGQPGADGYTPVKGVDYFTQADIASLNIPTNTSDLNNNSGFITGLFIATYGTTSFNDIKDAVQANKIVYCFVPSNNRYAFLAYGTTSSGYEFQYYRSLGSPSASDQVDEVYVYKINSGGWTTTTRKASNTITTGTGINSTYTASSRTMDLSVDTTTIATKQYVDTAIGTALNSSY